MNSVIEYIRTRFSTSPLGRRLFSGAIWSFVGAISTSGINLLVMMLVARLLGKEIYGQLVIVQSSLGMAGVLAGFGIGATASRYSAKLRLTDPERLSRVLALTERFVIVFSITALTVLAVSSAWLARNLLNAPDLATPITIASAALIFSALDGYQKSVLIGFEAMREIAKGTLLATIFGAPALFFLTHYFGLYGASYGLVVMALFQCIVSRFQMSGILRQAAISRITSNCFVEWKILRDYSLPSFLSNIMVLPAHWGCQVMLANTPGGYAEVAILGIAMQWFNAVLFIPTAVGRIILPVLTERLAVSEHYQVKKVIKVTTIVNVSIAFFVATVIIIISPMIVSFYGSEFKDGWLTLSMISVVAVLVVGAMPVGQFLAASNRMWLGAGMNFTWAIIYLVLGWTLSNKGALGIVIAMGLAYVAHTIWTVFWVRKHWRIIQKYKKKL